MNMRSHRKAVFAGAAALALAGVAGLVAAKTHHAHVLDLRLADGSLAHMRYVGDLPPTISIAPPPAAFSIVSTMYDPFGMEATYSALGRISEAMDLQGDTMAQTALWQTAQAPGGRDLLQADLGKLPPGAQGYSIVATISRGGVCARSVQYRSLEDGKPAQVVTRASGGCKADQTRTAPLATSGVVGGVAQPDIAVRQSI